jgi:ferredoxin--NADP+ reductase
LSGYVEGKIAARREWAPGLVTISVDAPIEPFEPGQFVNLGLELGGHLVRRSYSLASAPFARPEFYLTALASGELSPALLALDIGARVFVDPRPQGFFTLKWVPSATELWMLATGTGLAPFVSMLRTDEVWQRFERIVIVHGVRERAHLAYADEIAQHSRAHEGRLRCVPLVSREPEAPGVVHGRIPDALRDGRLEQAAGLGLSHERSHLMLCGNPGMIDGVMQVLEPRGFVRHRTRKPGHITTERYWET